MRHLLSVADLTAGELRSLLGHALRLKADPAPARHALDGRSILVLLAKPSFRTRVSFEVAMEQLGGHAIPYRLSESTVGQKEDLADLGAVGARYVDAVVARLFAQADLERLASRATVPVVNGLTDLEHPCQTLGDLLTMEETRGLEEAQVAYVGDGDNNVTHSLLLASALLGLRLKVACPPELPPNPQVAARAKELAKASGATLTVTADPREAVRGADFVYTDTWMSYHVAHGEAGRRRALLAPYQVNAKLMALAPGARFLHCLPATRGDEVTADVLDGPASLVLQQAENRLHAQKALLLWLLGRA